MKNVQESLCTKHILIPHIAYEKIAKSSSEKTPSNFACLGVGTREGVQENEVKAMGIRVYPSRQLPGIRNKILKKQDPTVWIFQTFVKTRQCRIEN